ncbi:hypothetical protein AQF52_5570 [Streptomyces venezuelae]|uniref:DUF4332 domain-containing protein n=1 Tax=Streptomyces gardneri TaxID=66892 RepID=UPI0006BDFFC9|nr:DUF4332 domain-containing protein [Streptomyces gardneri]ALO11164.1 hypothetical protein AQF52_5570 [Streptomyces venezuelae]QPK48096.1 DUF4332 domain-containing protein [Streptomyces gardneri]WRK39553.1 DUF4332 domain-containing protein [Streptomyces venezuelae]CUM38326.1 hypothetical protein BN2537_5617 [Streptomyces venezuelae]
MWRRVAQAAVAGSVIALAVVAPAGAVPSAPFDDAAEKICATAKAHREAGTLDRAKALYTTVKAGDGAKNCAVEGLKRVGEQRQLAAVWVLEGQKLIRTGDLGDARAAFESALEKDRGSAKAAAGIAQVARLEERPHPTASSNWDRFYDDWVKPLGRLLLFTAIAWAVLYALAGLASRVLVRVKAVAWPTPLKWTVGGVGAFLIFAAGVMLPFFGMFEPFSPGGPLIGWAGGVIVVIALTAVVLVLGTTTREPYAWKDWRGLLICLVAAAAAACGLLIAPLGFETRLMVAYIVLTVLGVLMTGAALGQNLRLQVEVQKADGAVSAAATDYLLARMKGLGTESPKALDRATSALTTTPLSQITSEELSALPAGKIVGALSRLFFVLRPDLTWRARVTLVDDDRVAISLSRNGRHAQTVVFSRPDLGLAAIPAGAEEAERAIARDRACAQMLTGAAASILLRLSEAHTELQDDLCGARHWKSVALQVIARSKSLIDEVEDQGAERVALLSRAMDQDPDYLLARFEYMWAVYERIPEETTRHADFARAIDRQYTSSGLSEMEDRAEGWVPLRIRVLYSSATQWLNGYVAGGKKDATALQAAARSVAELNRLCEFRWKREELTRQAERMRPFAENLKVCVEALHGRAPQGDEAWHPHEQAPPSPRLTYDHACLDSFLADLPGQDRALRLREAVEDLEFAVATDEDKSSAATDPCFGGLRTDDRFRRLVGTIPPEHFLDLPVLASHKESLTEAGIISASDLVRRTESTAQQARLAEHLKASPVWVDRLREVAMLALVHRDLSEPAMLHLLIAVDVASPAALREEARRNPRKLIRRIRSQASEERLEHLRGVRRPWLWLVAARR